MKLNLGAADRHIPGYHCIDLYPVCGECGSEPVDLSATWPWDDSSIEEIVAHDVVEHLPDRIAFMNHAWMALRPGGHLYITTPNAAKGGGFHQDPTHITPWTINTFKYFDPACFEWQRYHAAYGIIARFKTIHVIETSYQDPPAGPGCAKPDPVYKLDVRMEAVK